MDIKRLYEIILGDKPEAFQRIWPVYKEFLETTQASGKVETYFLDRQKLIDDFYRWLAATNRLEELGAIDRRSGTDRRGGPRPEAPGRRKIDFQNPFETNG